MTLAEQARENAYAPYSGFCVGAALLCDDGRVFVGCNMENAAYSETLCAERGAFASAVAAGCRGFAAIAVVGAPRGEAAETPCMPCGACRQVMGELCNADFRVLTRNGDAILTHTLRELLPYSFTLSSKEGSHEADRNE